MADHHHPQVPHTSDNDYVEHEKTYDLFLSLAKWGTVLTIILVMFIGSVTHLLPWALTLFVSVLGLAAASFM